MEKPQTKPELKDMNLRVSGQVHESVKIFLVKKSTPERKLQELTENLIKDGMRYRRIANND